MDVTDASYRIRNVQNDVIGLHDSTGTVVVSYSYDTWGNIVSITGSLKDSVGKKNPYRYRGYRYDEETGMYYLQSRYYNAEWGRFVNCDNIGGKIGELGTHNAFKYCFNNPVNMSDESGQWPKWMKKAAKAVKNVIKKVSESKVVKTVVQSVIKSKVLSSPILTAISLVAKTIGKVNKNRGTITIPILSVSGNAMASVKGTLVVTGDTRGNIALQVTGSGGGSIGSPSLNLSILGSPTFTNADNYKNLNGWGAEVGISAQATPFSIDASYAIIPRSNGKSYSGFSIKPGFGVSPLEIGFSEYGEAGFTYTLGVINIYDGTIDIFPKQ
ncbi:Hypothetical protein CM240_0116 [Clostridium bornimense]|uniref:RHS repeat-associated core domain-containing protein n=1 Tax=Clostridium bornimense TaxID=1216932 RepID=W6SCE3_9CLOT|nr:RHS repeat-associated core domain-containing protein [Clostridium bornimense]CDM67295.1 Hypothetical protein CM240_0116 [Clostridium bornimense]